jgi:hypothetical protein
VDVRERASAGGAEEGRPEATDPTVARRVMHGPNRCTATAKGTGERCRRAAIRGGTVCVKHGGSSPPVRAAANRRLEEREAATAAVRMLKQLGAEPPPDVHPVAHLLDELRQAAAVAEWLGPQAVMDGPKSGTWSVWERERDRRAKLAKTALDAGIAERQVRLAEDHATAVASVIRAVLANVRAALVAEIGARLVPPEPGERMIVIDPADRAALEATVNSLTVGRAGVEAVQVELRKLASAGGSADGPDGGGYEPLSS